MPAIPSEISKAIRRKKEQRIFLFLLAIVLIAVMIVIFEKYGTSYEDIDVLKYFFYTALFIASFFVTKIYLIFTDTDYCGVVKKVDVETVLDNKSAAKPSMELMFRKNVTYLTVEDETGKTFRKKAAENPRTPNSDTEVYKVGDKVLHLHGTGITVVLPTAADTRCQCAMCGGSNDKTDDVCAHCGFPLIKSIEK